MFLNSLILAFSSSIDSLGIGITYGIRNTRISIIGKIVLFTISFSISIFSICFGNILKCVFSNYLIKIIGNIILILMGVFVCFQAIKKDKTDSNLKNVSPNLIYKNNEKIYSFFIKFLGITIKIIKNPNLSDLDSSNIIDGKEALFLGFALSLDCFCISISGSIIGIHPFIFPLLISIFQLIFLSIGNIIGKKVSYTCLSDNIWSIISGILLILIGLFKFINI